MNLDLFQRNGKYLMLAFDHRGSFKKLMNPEDSEAVTDQMAIDLKKEIIDAVSDQFTSLLIDEEFGLPAYPNRVRPFLLPVEKTGYTDQGGERVTELEYGVPRLMELGASGAKLLLYFNPNYKSVEKQLETARNIVDECKNRDYPLFLELVTYKTEGEVSAEEREELVLSSIKLFLERNIIPDVFKLEYPGNALACQKITTILGENPWIILTRGDTFENFKVQLEEAAVRGCQGFLAGRSLWQEVCRMQGEEKQKFLKEILPERFRVIAGISTRT